MKQNIPFKSILVTMMLTLSAVVMAQTNNDDDVEVRQLLHGLMDILLCYLLM